MTTNVVQFIPKHDICHECYKRRTTKLCDFIIGQTEITFYRSFSLFKNQQPRFLTCDKPTLYTQEEAKKYPQCRWVALEELG